MGFFEDAEVEVTEAPDDPYGFGKDFWPIYVVDVFDVKPTNNGNRFGMMVRWAVDHPKYQNHPVSKQLGYGNWVQLPVPKPLQGQIPWDVKSEEGQKVLFNLKQILSALGFSVDEMGKVGPDEMKGRRCLAKISVKFDGQYWQLNPYAFKSIPEDEVSDGINEFAGNSSASSGEAVDPLEKELNDI